MNEFLRLSLVELTAALREKQLSPVDLMAAVLDRIEATHDALNAVVSMHDREDLLAQAREAEARILSGDARPLEGVPMGVKDLFDAKGLLTTSGSLVFKDRMAEADCTEVARFRNAGAIVVGKTNTPEFGYTAITKNLVYGDTRNPWALDRSPGGSSGGSAASLTSNGLPLVTSSDGGGSIRIPASFTGAFGLKPSFGRIPLGPMSSWYYIHTTSRGPITKTVADAALFLDQVVGVSPCDPQSLPHPGYSYVAKLNEPAPTGLRMGYSADFEYAVVQSDIAEAVYDGSRVFEALGHKVSQIRGGPPPAGGEWGLLNAFETAGDLHQEIQDSEEKFGKTFVRGVKAGWKLTPERFGEIAQSRSRINDWTAEFFENYDLLITPTVPYDPPPPRGPFPSETEGRVQPPWGVASFTIPFNLSGHPAATVRAGFSKNGLPIGMQIVGPRHRDDLVLQVAQAFERERPWHPHWAESF